MSETSKQRRSRIDLTYYRTPDAQARRRGRLTLLALAIAGLWFAVAPLWGRGRGEGVRLFRRDALASKGPLARVHTIWDDECQACHVPFRAINGSRWSPSLRGATHGSEESCRTCHAGPDHARSQRAEEVPSCAECHRDHRGRDASLLAIDDAACVGCHRDLPGHRDPSAGPMRVAASSTRFGADPAEHPAFTPPLGVPGPDARRIKFNHSRHLAPGLTTEPGGAPFTFAGLSREDRARYGWAPGRDAEPVQLRCDACHRLDAADAAGPRSTGDSMLPVRYDNDCRACHPLTFEPADPGRRIAHGLRPAEVVDQLRTYYASRALESEPALLRRFVPVRAIPGRPSPSGVEEAGKAVARKAVAAARRFFGSAVDDRVREARGLPTDRGGCALCHDLSGLDGPLDLESAARLEIAPVVVRSIWFEGARFDHATHRALECGACHEGASESTGRDRLLLPDASHCVGCHAPSSTSGGRPRGGAGTACVECHRYHAADHPAEGPGAASRRARARMTVEQFLDGGPRPEG